MFLRRGPNIGGLKADESAAAGIIIERYALGDHNIRRKRLGYRGRSTVFGDQCWRRA
jgi:hypothetical protein